MIYFISDIKIITINTVNGMPKAIPGSNPQTRRPNIIRKKQIIIPNILMLKLIKDIKEDW